MDLEIIEKFRAWLNVRGLSSTTEKVYIFRLGKFLNWLGDRSFLHVTQIDAVTWRNHLAESYSPASIAIHLVSARRFYTFLFESGKVPVNPFAGVVSPRRKSTSRRETINGQEWQKLLSTCDGSLAGLRAAAIFWLAYGLGLRQIEIRRADLEDLRVNDGLHILWVQSKGAIEKGDWLLIPPLVKSALDAWIHARGDQPGALFTCLNGSGRLSLSAIRMIWNEHKKKAGIVSSAKTFHSLRHSAIDNRARYAVKHGKSPLLVQAFARHKRMATTEIYIHTVERMQDPPEMWLL